MQLKSDFMFSLVIEVASTKQYSAKSSSNQTPLEARYDLSLDSKHQG